MSDIAAKVREFLESPTTWAPWKLRTPEGLTLTPNDLRALLNRLEAAEAKIRRCPECDHAPHGEECEEVVGYDHLNGDHECGCPGPLTQEDSLLDDYDPVPGLVAHGVVADPEDVPVGSIMDDVDGDLAEIEAIVAARWKDQK